MGEGESVQALVISLIVSTWRALLEVGMRSCQAGLGARKATGHRPPATGISTGNTPAGLQRRDYKENAENQASTHDKYPLKGSDIFTTYPLRVMVRCMRQVADQCLCIHSWSCDHRPVRQRKQEQKRQWTTRLSGAVPA